MNILLLSTGSVSAYLSHKLAYQLKGDGHEVKHVLSLAGEHFDIVNEELAHFLRADLIKLVDSAHNVPGALAHAVHGIEAV